MELLFNINKRLFFNLKSRVYNIAEIIPGCLSERNDRESPSIEPWVGKIALCFYSIIYNDQ